MLSERAVGPRPRGAWAEAGAGPSGARAKGHVAPALAAPALPVEMQGAGGPQLHGPHLGVQVRAARGHGAAEG